MPAHHPMTPRRVVLLGATGSIGRQALDVIRRHPDRLQLVGAVSGSDVAALEAVMLEHDCGVGAVVAPPAGIPLPAGVASGAVAAIAVAAMDADVVCVGIAGAAALLPTLAAVDAGRDVAIATKEVLVMAGDLVRSRARAGGARLLPVDSEHSALWQCLRGERPESVARLILTASGGPFRDLPVTEFAHVTRERALQHPTWVMGPKITIDSATMMNKGLEIIEAHFLFDVPFARIEAVVHPSSIVHSAVEFVDGATIAQIGHPDMRVPIALALTGGERLPNLGPGLDLGHVGPLEFSPVDPQRFPAVALARSAGERGGGAPCILNAANEAAVAAFLAGRCQFTDVVALVAAALDDIDLPANPDLDALLELDRIARRHVDAAVATGVRS